MVLLVSPHLPLHQGLSLPLVVSVDQALLHSVHNMVVIGAGVLPDQHGPVHHVAVAEIALPEHVEFAAGGRVLNQTCLSVLELFSFGDLRLEKIARHLKLVLNVAELHRIIALFHQSFHSESLNLIDEGLFLLVVLVLSCSVTPVLPRCEFKVRCLGL